MTIVLHLAGWWVDLVWTVLLDKEDLHKLVKPFLFGIGALWIKHDSEVRVSLQHHHQYVERDGFI